MGYFDGTRTVKIIMDDLVKEASGALGLQARFLK
jgi:hypothetical protein